MNILFYGGHYWNKGPWFRKQQFAHRLCLRGHSVCYLEDSVSIVRKNYTHSNHLLKLQTRQLKDKCYIFTPSVYFPYPQNYFSRYLYNLKLMIDIHRFYAQKKIKDFVIWYNMLPFSSVVSLYKNRYKIFDLCDDIPAYPLLFNDQKLHKLYYSYLRQALTNCDIPIVSAIRLKEKYSHLCTKEMLLAPNGHSFAAQSSVHKTAPDRLRNYNKPWIGFIGTLFKFIDDDLLSYLAMNRPNYTFIFVGKIEDNFPKEKLSKHGNVVLIEQVPREKISDYIASFDVAINPFRRHEVNDSVNPVKVFEYLAHSKNIVSTSMYSLQHEMIAPYIHFAENPARFLEHLDTLCNHPATNQIPEQIIAQYHWDNIFNNLLRQISEKYNFRL